MKITPAYVRYGVVALVLATSTFYGLYQLSLTGNTDPGELAHVEEYLSITNKVDEGVAEMATVVFAMAEGGQYDLGRLTNILFQIEELKKETPTEQESFKELEKRNRQMLETLRKLTLIIYEPPQSSLEERNNQWRQQTNELNRLLESRGLLVREMLEAEGLVYHENSDGSLSYWKP